jgi:hypothetical protein
MKAEPLQLQQLACSIIVGCGAKLKEVTGKQDLGLVWIPGIDMPLAEYKE